MSLQERLTLQEALNVDSLEGLVRFAGTVLKMTLVFELTGARVMEYGDASGTALMDVRRQPVLERRVDRRDRLARPDAPPHIHQRRP